MDTFIPDCMSQSRIKCIRKSLFKTRVFLFTEILAKSNWQLCSLQGFNVPQPRFFFWKYHLQQVHNKLERCLPQIKSLNKLFYNIRNHLKHRTILKFGYTYIYQLQGKVLDVSKKKKVIFNHVIIFRIYENSSSECLHLERR